jgi:hypothetical protein
MVVIFKVGLIFIFILDFRIRGELSSPFTTATSKLAFFALAEAKVLFHISAVENVFFKVN